MSSQEIPLEENKEVDYDAILMECKQCHQLLNRASFPESSRVRGRFLCRDCLRERVAKARGKDDITRRLLVNLRQRCSSGRNNSTDTKVTWTLEDVQELIDKWDAPPKLNKRTAHKDSHLRIRVTQIDKEKPLAPGNARIVCYVR